MRTVKLSKRASKKLVNLLDFLEKEWSAKVKADFISKLDKSLIQVKMYPDSCVQTDMIKGLHMLVVTKHTSLFYRYNSKSITVVTLFDNRMNPDKLKKDLH